jgi:hypothetical protein
MIVRDKAICALITMLCVTMVLLFPSEVGSYTATNGPATAMRALQASLHVHAALGSAVQSAAASPSSRAFTAACLDWADQGNVSELQAQPIIPLRC